MVFSFTYGGPGVQNNTMSPYKTRFVSIADQGRPWWPWWPWWPAEGDCVHFPIGDGEALEGYETRRMQQRESGEMVRGIETFEGCGGYTVRETSDSNERRGFLQWERFEGLRNSHGDPVPCLVIRHPTP